MPTQIGNVKYTKPWHELLQFRFVASWQAFRHAVREKHVFLHHDNTLLKDFLFAPRFTYTDSGSS
jgi:hypothetical protein